MGEKVIYVITDEPEDFEEYDGTGTEITVYVPDDVPSDATPEMDIDESGNQSF
jgi:hypothetical protein